MLAYVVLNEKKNQMNGTEILGLESIYLVVAEAPDSCWRNFCSAFF